jgi:hypothetical protein
MMPPMGLYTNSPTKTSEELVDNHPTVLDNRPPLNDLELLVLLDSKLAMEAT